MSDDSGDVPGSLFAVASRDETREEKPRLADPVLRKEVEGAIASALNRNSLENGSNTPDFILAEYLTDCLAAFDRAVAARDAWYGIAPSPGSALADHARRSYPRGQE